MANSGFQFNDFLGRNVTHVVSPRGSRPASGNAHVVIDVEGVADLIKKFERMGNNARKIAGNVLYKEGQAVIALAKEQYVPIDTGALKDSGFVKQPQYTGDAVIVSMGFGPSLSERRRRGGRSGSEYAVPVHEIPAAHQFGEWKYLQTPFLIRMADFERRAKDAITRGVYEAAMNKMTGDLWSSGQWAS